jgi:serine/threonine protein kinase
MAKIGKYEIESELGRGGFGRIYRAFDPTVNRRVAIKVLTAVDNPEVLARFKNEAVATGNLRHPNIITIYEFGEEQGSPYLVMEYLEGQDLQQIMAAKQPLSLLDKVQIMAQVAEGLHAAHKCGVVHRDVKPSNIRVLPDGHVKVMDFGIARLMRESTSRITQSGLVIGTIKYLSPEQLQEAEPDALCDIFAYGVVFYEFLAGKHPFEAPDFHSMMYKLVSVDPAPLSEAAPDLPEGLEAIVMRAMAKDRELRYQSLNDLFLDLQVVLLSLQTARSQALLGDARALASSGRIAEAEPILRNIVELDPANREARQLLSQVVASLRQRFVSSGIEANLRAADDQISRGLLAEAAESLEAALRLYPGQPEFAKRLEEVRGLRQQQAETEARQHGEPPAVATRGPNADTTMLVDAKSADLPPPDQPGAPPPPDLTAYFGTADVEEPLRASVTIVSCPDSFREGEMVAVRSSPFTIGRGEGDLLISEDRTLSRRHAAITRSGSGFSIRDLGTSNGTYLNGRRLAGDQDEPLPLNAEIRLSTSTRLRFRCDISELPDFTGQKLAGRYTLEECLRAGRKSALYEAMDSRPVRKVAVKLLSPTLASYPGYLEQFEQEAQTAAELDHPHICRIYEYGRAPLAFSPGQTRSVPYLCMQLLDGGSLNARLDAPEHTSPAAVADWLDLAASALKEAHRNGVIHAGIKPTAIVFSASGVPYVTDFAIAIRPRGETRSRPNLGSPEYLAPEQWDGLVAGPESDQYSLACLCYRVLTGAVPFENQRDPDARARNFEQGAVPAHVRAKAQRRPPVPESVSNVLARAMSIRPGDRFPDVAAFAAAFRRAMGESAPRDRKPQVFVSYRRQVDAGWAALFADKLTVRHGLDVFIDRHRVDSASQVPEKIQSAIRDCDIFVCLLSRSTLDSDWVREEIRLADVAGKPMIPVVHEGFRRPRTHRIPDWLKLLIPRAWLQPESVRRLMDAEEVRLFADFDEAAIEKLAKMILHSARKS